MTSLLPSPWKHGGLRAKRLATLTAGCLWLASALACRSWAERFFFFRLAVRPGGCFLEVLLFQSSRSKAQPCFLSADLDRKNLSQRHQMDLWKFGSKRRWSQSLWPPKWDGKTACLQASALFLLSLKFIFLFREEYPQIWPRIGDLVKTPHRYPSEHPVLSPLTKTGIVERRSR